MPMATNRMTGKVGRYVYVIVGPRGTAEYFGLARWEAAYMMSVNNGKGRGWSVVRFERPASTERAET